MRPVRKQSEEHEHPRYNPRVHSLRDISLTYEGGSEKIIIRSPDISARGMYINTNRVFPEGSILSVQFRLAISGIEIRTRCEVRYCVPGAGMGVEFIEISKQAVQAIEQEVASSEKARSVPIRKRRKPQRVSVRTRKA